MTAHLTKEKVEVILDNISSSCRKEMEMAMDSQMELRLECKNEIQDVLAMIPGVNPSEGTSKRMKMMRQPPIPDAGPPPELMGQEPIQTSPMFDFFIIISSIITGIICIVLFMRRKKGSSTDAPTKKMILKGIQKRGK
jgi:hypothetical protein